MTSSSLCTRILQLILAGILIGSLAAPVVAYDLGSGTPATGAASISNGDPVTLHGIATGHPRDGLQVWVVGKNYLKISTIQVNNDNTFEFELRPSDTSSLAPGQFFVVVQHPMMNGQFDVYLDASSGRVINRQSGTGGQTIYQMSGSGSLQGPDSAQALVNAISSQNIDDTFTTYTFTINPPTAFIDPIGDHAVGDKFTISGSTNLATGDQLLVEITSSSFGPSLKTSASEFSGASGMVIVVPGSGGYNRWFFAVDATNFKPDEYLVKVSGVTIDVTGSTVFNVFAQRPATMATPVVSPSATPVEPTPIATPATPLPTPPAKSPLPLALAMMGLVAAAAIKKAER